MEIGAVYLQPITMDPEGMMRKASDSDIHLEADIHAVKNNPTGFAEGDWMPYLQVTYKLTKQGDTKWKAEGDLMGMVASDGPHYGDNVKLNGPGKYHLTMVVKPPMQTGPWRSAVTSTRKRAWAHGSSPLPSSTTSRSPVSARRAVTDRWHHERRASARRRRREPRMNIPQKIVAAAAALWLAGAAYAADLPTFSSR